MGKRKKRGQELRRIADPGDLKIVRDFATAMQACRFPSHHRVCAAQTSSGYLDYFSLSFGDLKALADAALRLANGAAPLREDKS